MFKRTFWLLAALAVLTAACASPAAMPEPVEVIVEREAVEAPAAEPGFDTGGFADQATSLDEQGVPGAERLVIKNANLSIVVDDPVQSMSEIAQMAETMDGFVVSSNLFQTELESGLEVPRASITIRVPAERLAEALSLIEGSAIRVLSRNESGQDVTQEYTDLQSRLRNLEDAEAQLRSIMEEARRTEDVLSVFNELTRVREQIEVIKGQIQFFEQSAAFSAISVEVIASEAVQPLTIGGWEPVGVAKNALQALINAVQFLVNAAIWLVLFILPVLILLLIPLALIWWGVRNWRARRKKARLAAQPPPEAEA